MAEFVPNPRAVQGGNQTAFDDAVATFDFVGFLLARHETLMRAALDDKVDRACLRVLCVLIATMNRDTRTSWAGREYISQQLGMTAKTVSNYIYQLKQLGYLVSERRATPLADGRVLMHYTLSKLKPAEIEDAIERAIASIRGQRNPVVQFPHPQEVTAESSCPDGKSVPVPTGTQTTSSRPDRKSQVALPAGTGSQKLPVPVPAGSQGWTLPVAAGTEAESSCQDGHSNNNSSFLLTSNTESSGERGVGREKKTSARPSRLPDDWKLPQRYGVWAMEHFEITDRQVRLEAESFSDYWTSLGNTRHAAKKDWFKTWRNWIRNSKKGWRLKKLDDTAENDFLTAAEGESEHAKQIEIVRRQREQERSRNGRG